MVLSQDLGMMGSSHVQELSRTTAHAFEASQSGPLKTVWKPIHAEMQHGTAQTKKVDRKLLCLPYICWVIECNYSSPFTAAISTIQRYEKISVALSPGMDTRA